MCAKIILAMLLFVSCLSVFAQSADSTANVELESVIVTGSSFKTIRNRKSAIVVDVVEKRFLKEYFTGNLMQSLEHMPGVRSMDIGSGFSKPMIRGMGFNRISVSENGIKQEGQQWGSDHGLEIDAFNVERVIIRKGPSSLLYGSDAMGGVIEISQAPPPFENQIFGDIVLLGKTVNENIGGSVSLGIKKDSWYGKLRYSEQQFGDYRIPTDTIIYLTQQIPIHGRKLKNTAGIERNFNFYSEYKKWRYSSNYAVSNAYQKVGFFPGAHGIPDASRIHDDGDSRNIELPHSLVNHFKLTSHQQYMWDNVIGSWDFGFQNNHREEWSLFHTHYGAQLPPAIDPDKELEFNLDTYSSLVKVKMLISSLWELDGGWDMQFQNNNIDGYSFLLPAYKRFTSGLFGVVNWNISQDMLLSGGLRYDYCGVDAKEYKDPYLKDYLHGFGYDDSLLKRYEWRSYSVNRKFSNLSGSLGIVWSIKNKHLLKSNIGNSFRLPGANELSSNGVHHGTFRHEQGDPMLDSERGWHIDMSYQYAGQRVNMSLSPFVNWFENYIHLRPTGEWSVLPHAGQIYRYTGNKAIFAGAEIDIDVGLFAGFVYKFVGEYVYTYNIDERTPLSFSPPPSMRNTLMWRKKQHHSYVELLSIATQNRTAKNEDPTKGAHLLQLGVNTSCKIGEINIDIGLTIQNVFDTKYYNHLSFYRKVEIPEPGRNFQLLIKIPFQYKL